jgi:uncharacterized protein
MRFWDSSAVIPLLVEESSSPQVRAAHAEDIGMVAWWATGVECVSALARLEREERLDAGDLGDALARLDELAAGWIEIQPVQRVRQSALRLLRVHPLRAGDALQLAAAIAAAEDHPSTMPFVTLDERLALAAQREGFRVIPRA